MAFGILHSEFPGTEFNAKPPRPGGAEISWPCVLTPLRLGVEFPLKAVLPAFLPKIAKKPPNRPSTVEICTETGVGPRPTGVGPRPTGVGLRQTGVGPRQTGVGLRRIGVSPRQTRVGSRQTGVSLRRTGVGRSRTFGRALSRNGAFHFIHSVVPAGLELYPPGEPTYAVRI